MRKYGVVFLICLFASLLSSCSTLSGEKKSVELLEEQQFEEAVEYSRGKNEEVQELVQNIVCVRFIRYMGDSAQHIKELTNMSEDIIWSALASYQKYSKVILDDEETDLFLDKNAQVAEILTFVQKEYPKEIFPDDFSECYDEYTDILSRMIGMANGLLEAEAGGRPVLASDIPGCRETFDDGVTGFGFEVKNEKSLESAIEKFCLLSNAERAAMGKAARKKVENEFDRKNVVKAYLDAIHEFGGQKNEQPL